MPRKWINYPKDIQLSTPLGDVYLTVTQRNHINVDGSRDGKYITVNKVEYQTSFHLMQQEDGSYQLDKSGYGIRGSRTYRCSKGSYNNDQMSDAAKNKVEKVIVPLVNEWALCHSAILEQAQYGQEA